ncbi:D-alanyl-D-alanine carboxypeptidase family protein [Fructobacillus tropaeoli]|uniref:D-alanyl-D-alanine carboxypeptidase family protein n=1 Tax=Fructobacillus tropaeoli TaxID=709323 RepID=UPI0019430490|nr:serine hydrolase [Fructobacillus tropaeoli]GIC70725.1 D-alanyl-D-alanine carboxypeptidase [Fructobacillus tropaeoli]
MNEKPMYRLQAANRKKKRGRFWAILIAILVLVLAMVGAGLYFLVPDDVKSSIQATKDQPVSLNVDATSAVVIDLTSGQILGEKDANKQAPIASESKMLVAYGVLKAIENNQLKWTDQVTVPASADLSAQNADAISHLNMKTGDKLSVRDLYWAMFTNSANDAALTLTAALTKPGQTAQQTLESLASDLNLKGTAWYNGAGLTNGDSYNNNEVTSASDSAANHASAMQVAEIAKKIMTMDPTLKTVTANPTITYTKNKTVKVTETSDFGQGFANIVKGLDNENGLKILGLKTGSTPEAGACFTGYVVDQQGHEFLTVVNNAADYTDTKQRFQTTIDMVNQVLAKKKAHTYTAGKQLTNHKTVGVDGESKSVDVQVAASKTYWTSPKKSLKIQSLKDLKSRPDEKSTDVVTYAKPELKATFLPGLSDTDKEIPLQVLTATDKK